MGPTATSITVDADSICRAGTPCLTFVSVTCFFTVLSEFLQTCTASREKRNLPDDGHDDKAAAQCSGGPCASKVHLLYRFLQIQKYTSHCMVSRTAYKIKEDISNSYDAYNIQSAAPQDIVRFKMRDAIENMLEIALNRKRALSFPL